MEDNQHDVQRNMLWKL